MAETLTKKHRAFAFEKRRRELSGEARLVYYLQEAYVHAIDA
ncbi:hypothetical protein [Pelagicoccus sp. SDUM812005]|nr:hypothetical protein [Pelagicoccus sp. SDUM812005]MDQ8180516.1 hypothetical protein [Pelagicoccus sp. SDUM812005]